MTGRYASCQCFHYGYQHRADGSCIVLNCGCGAFTRARAPMPSTHGAGQLRPLQKPKKGPLIDKEDA